MNRLQMLVQQAQAGSGHIADQTEPSLQHSDEVNAINIKVSAFLMFSATSMARKAGFCRAREAALLCHLL